MKAKHSGFTDLMGRLSHKAWLDASLCKKDVATWQGDKTRGQLIRTSKYGKEKHVKKWGANWLDRMGEISQSVFCFSGSLLLGKRCEGTRQRSGSLEVCQNKLNMRACPDSFLEAQLRHCPSSWVSSSYKALFLQMMFKTALSPRVNEGTSMRSPTILVPISLQGLKEEISFPSTSVRQARDSIWSTRKQFFQLLTLHHVSPIPLPPPAAWTLSLPTEDVPQTLSC